MQMREQDRKWLFNLAKELEQAQRDEPEGGGRIQISDELTNWIVDRLYEIVGRYSEMGDGRWEDGKL